MIFECHLSNKQQYIIISLTWYKYQKLPCGPMISNTCYLNIFEPNIIYLDIMANKDLKVSYYMCCTHTIESEMELQILVDKVQMEYQTQCDYPGTTVFRGQQVVFVDSTMTGSLLIHTHISQTHTLQLTPILDYRKVYNSVDPIHQENSLALVSHLDQREVDGI